MAFTDEPFSQSATYLKVIQWTTAGKLKAVLLKPQQKLAAENIGETTKISELEKRAKQATELLDLIQVAVDAEKKKPLSENEDSTIQEGIFEEVTERVDAAKRHVEGLARSINETGIQNYDSGNKFRDKIKALDTELDVIAAAATKIPSLANNIKAEDLRKLLMLKPKLQAKAIEDLVKQSDPENVLGIKAGLTSFVEKALEAPKIVEAKLELVEVQKKRLSQLASNVEKNEKDMTSLDREIDALAQTIKEKGKLASIVGAVPALKNRIQSTMVQTRMQMS